jgi:uncharacterized protein (AIM24 family)
MNDSKISGFKDLLMWISPVVALVGSVGGSYFGVTIAVVRLETQQIAMKEEIRILQEHEQAYAAPRSGYIQQIQDHERRIVVNENDIKGINQQVQKNVSDIEVLKAKGR